MTDESLSALLDGECDPRETDRLLDALAADPALAERFSRLCRSRDLRTGHGGRRADPGFSARVLTALGEAAPERPLDLGRSIVGASRQDVPHAP